jgi:hypothetical protein
MRYLIGTALAAAITGSAFAAEPLPPPLPVLAYNWTGLYGGINGGGGWGQQDPFIPPAPLPARIFVLSYEGTAPMRYGSRGPASQICRAAAGDGSVLSWSPWTVDECDCPRLFFRPERIHGLWARMTRQGREKFYANHNRH